MTTEADPFWRRRAACRNDPDVPQDSWFSVSFGNTRGAGAEAVLVCRLKCSVMLECRERYEGAEVIWGGGWRAAKGAFRGADTELLDIYLAGAYLGMSPTHVQRLGDRGVLKSVTPSGKKSWFRLEDVKKLAETHGVRHATVKAQRLHRIRGEEYCTPCQQLDELMRNPPAPDLQLQARARARARARNPVRPTQLRPTA